MAYQDAIMRKAAKLTSDPRRDIPQRQPQDFDTPRVDTETNTKDFNKPQQAEPIRSSEPDVILKYPQDENYLAYMLFRVKKINPWDIDVQEAKKILDTPALTGEKARYKAILDLVGDDNTNYSDQFNTAEFQGVPENNTKKFNNSSNTANNAAKDAANNQQGKDILGITHEYVDDLPAIKLYMPQAINFNDNVIYNNGQLGASGAAASAAINAGGSLRQGLQAFLGDALGFIGDAFGTAANDPGLRRLALNRAAQAIPTGSQLNNAAALGFQVTVNPNTRVLFEGVTIRDFQFQFDFYPVSFAESQVVQKIVKFFRTELYPSTIGRQAGVPIGFNFPHVFEIKFRIGDRNAPMPQPHLCYLRNVQTTYNPGSMSFFDDGSPTHTSMSLSFSEFRTLSKEDINEGR